MSDRCTVGGARDRAAIDRRSFLASLPIALDAVRRDPRPEARAFASWLAVFIEHGATATAAAELVPAAPRRGGDPRSEAVQEIAELLRDHYLREMRGVSYRSAASLIRRAVEDYRVNLYEPNRKAGRFPTAPLQYIAHVGLSKGGLIRAGKIISETRISRFLSSGRNVFQSRNERQMVDPRGQV